ncbi:MAG: hypothetical protein Q3982_03165 [Phoenicibacter congonensis]|uniref:Uncharacterized protein n=1 Tax=Phoenicibacter congonensis TaxID=1944646 RepID=A0AA43RGZ5_9ACTN|nr:hypothetical protein [Phoenicibacter congonensis]
MISHVVKIPSKFVSMDLKIIVDNGIGESKLFIGDDSRRNEFDDFFGFGTSIKYRFDRENLLCYLHEAKLEYIHHFFNQYKNVDLEKWERNVELV